MISLLLQFVCTCAAVQFSVQEGNIAFPLRSKVEYYLPYWIRKPLYGCLPCMASVWGTVVFFANGNHLSVKWPAFILVACGVNVIIDKFYGDFTDDN